MNAVIEFLNGAGDQWVRFFIPMLIQSSLMILAIWGIDWLIRKRVTAIFRYCLWLLVIVKLMLPVTLAAPTGLGWYLGGFGETLIDHWQNRAVVAEPVTELPSPVTVPEALFYNSEPIFPMGMKSEMPMEIPASRPEPTASVQAQTVTPSQAPAVELTWWGGLVAVWLALILLVTLLIAQRWQFVRGLIRQADPADAGIIDLLDRCRRQLGMAEQIELRLSPNTTSPSVCGLLRPVILIPHDLPGQLSTHQMRAVLLHELTHIKRYDLWVSFIQTAIQTVYFFHPLLWLANAMIRNMREKAVDEAVLAAMGQQAEDYPRTLLELSRTAFSRPSLSLRLIGVVESKSALKDRISHMSARPFPTSARIGLAGLAGLLIAGLVLIPMAGAAKETGGEKQIKKDINEAISILSQSTERQSENLRRVFSLIQKHPADQTLEQLVPYLSNRKITKLRSAIYIIDMLEWPDGSIAVGPLTELLNYKETTTRGMAAMALASLGDQDSYDAIAEMLRRNPDRYVRRCAAWALGQLKDDRAVGILEDAITSDKADIVDNAQNALQRLQFLREYRNVDPQTRKVVDGIWLIAGSTENHEVRINRALEAIRSVAEPLRVKLFYQFKQFKPEHEYYQNSIKNAVMLAEMKLSLLDAAGTGSGNDEGILFLVSERFGLDREIIIERGLPDRRIHCQAIRFEDYSSSSAKIMIARLNYQLLSGPKGSWIVSVRLLGGDGLILGQASQYVENSGIIAGVAAVSSETMKLVYEGIEARDVERFDIVIKSLDANPAPPVDPTQAGASFQRHFVRLVVDPDSGQATFEGQPVILGDPSLDRQLKSVPNRGNTVLEIALAPGEQDAAQWWQANIELVHQLDSYRFEYLSQVGYHPLGSTGSATEYFWRAPLDKENPISVNLTLGDKVLQCQSVQFHSSRNRTGDTIQFWRQVPAEYQNQWVAELKYTLVSWPKGQWDIRLRSLDRNNQELGCSEQTIENTGLNAGQPFVSNETALFYFDNAAVLQASSVELRVVPRQQTAPPVSIITEDQARTMLATLQACDDPAFLAEMIYFENDQQRQDFEVLTRDEKGDFKLFGSDHDQKIYLVSLRPLSATRTRAMTLMPIKNDQYMPYPITFVKTDMGIKFDLNVGQSLKNALEARTLTPQEFGKRRIQEQIDLLEAAEGEDLTKMFESSIAGQKEQFVALECAREHDINIISALAKILQEQQQRLEKIDTPQAYKEAMLAELRVALLQKTGGGMGMGGGQSSKTSKVATVTPQKSEKNVSSDTQAPSAVKINFKVVSLSRPPVMGAENLDPTSQEALAPNFKFDVDKLIEMARNSADGNALLMSPLVTVRGGDVFTVAIDSPKYAFNFIGRATILKSGELIKLDLQYDLVETISDSGSGTPEKKAQSIVTSATILPDTPVIVGGLNYNNLTLYIIANVTIIDGKEVPAIDSQPVSVTPEQREKYLAALARYRIESPPAGSTELVPATRSSSQPPVADIAQVSSSPQPVEYRPELKPVQMSPKPKSMGMTVAYQDTPLEEVIADLRMQTGLNFVVMWDELDKLGILPDDPVRMQLRQVSPATVLKQALACVSGGKTGAATYRVDDDGIVVIRAAKPGEDMVFKTYYIADLVLENPLMYGGMGMGSGYGGMGYDRFNRNGDRNRSDRNGFEMNRFNSNTSYGPQRPGYHSTSNQRPFPGFGISR